MLFLYRPRQTRMPYTTRRSQTEQGQYNRQLQERFAATQRVPPRPPSPATPQPWPQRDDLAALRELAQLHAAGTLTDAEFATAKARVLGSPRRVS